MPKPTCSIPECTRPREARSWCNTHYQRWRRNGHPELQPKLLPIDRFLSYVVAPAGATGCWFWTGGHKSEGYAAFSFGHGRTSGAHRWSYEFFNGTIPAGLVIDHLCRNRGCVNPMHLEAVTDRVNTLRGANQVAANAAKTHCVHGHAFDAENTRRTRRGRVCRSCERNRPSRQRP